MPSPLQNARHEATVLLREKAQLSKEVAQLRAENRELSQRLTFQEYRAGIVKGVMR